MRLVVLLSLAVAALAVAGCGPDCDRFCTKLFDCDPARFPDRARCIQGCDEVGGDRMAYINCVLDPTHTCQDITSGAHCSLPQ